METVQTLINKKYYIIKVECDYGKKVYYKIGEGNTSKRPETLVEKYNKLRANKATLLYIDDLPTTKNKRLNDKLIHKSLDTTIFKKADPIYIEHYLDESDGKDEFFELLDSAVNPVDYIKELVAKIKPVDYTANAIYNSTLAFKKDEYHLVDADIIAKIIDTYNSVNKELYHYINNNILLIGQFEPEFIASIAMFHNITLWHDSAEQKHEYKFNRINNNITYIDTLGELLMSEKDFDIIISNPPYGKVGAEITHNIIDNIDYKEFVNLLPANDYHRGNDNLYKYADIDNMVSIRNGFVDAFVTTHLTKINKKPSKITEAEFEIKNFIIKYLEKYFFENIKRIHYALDNFTTWIYFDSNLTNDTTFIAEHRLLSNKHLAYKNNLEYKWNVEKSVNLKEIENSITNNCTPGKTNKYAVTFNTSIEKDNITKFVYNNRAFIAMLLTCMNCDSTSEFNKFLPKVDWTREWTVEEILADYGYTESEIKEVMDDLVNFKDMDR